MKTKAQLKEEGFTLTDSDSNQWVKKITETNFLVYDNENEFDIELNDYSEEELDDYTAAYYPSLPEMRELYRDSANQIIAECIAEQTTHFVEDDY